MMGLNPRFFQTFLKDNYQFIVVMITTISYFGIYRLLFPYTGHIFGSLVTIPIILVGWFYGKRLGVIFGGTSTTATVVLRVLTEHANLLKDLNLSIVIIIFVGILIGGSVGWISETRHKLHSEITQRKIAELALQKRKEMLANQVEKQTHELRAEKLRIERIIEMMPHSILVLNTVGTVSLANKAFKDLYYTVNQETLPNNWNVFDPPVDELKTQIITVIKLNSASMTVNEPQREIHLQLQVVHEKFSNWPFFLGTIIVFQDISKFIEYERLRKQFVSMVSHELRTPLAAINLLLITLQKYREKLTEHQKVEKLEKIRKQTKLMIQIVEDLLILSRIESGKISLSKSYFNLENVIKEVITQLTPVAKMKSIKMDMDIIFKINIVGDSQRIAQIIRILLENAIKYSPVNTSVQISAQKYCLKQKNETKDESVVIQVKDTGRGIHPRDLPCIFERFYRSEEVKHIQGTGLGLAIAKELCILHGGDITAESNYGQGSIFTVILPQ